MERSAVIVGGGLSGLASAIALRQAGWNVTVLEAAEQLQEVGAGISLWPNSLRALDLLGVGDRVRARGAVEGSAGFRDRRGRWLLRTDATELEKRYGPSIIIRRRVLLNTLREALPEECIRLATAVTGVRTRAGQVSAHWADGATSADLLVGADGIHSTVRNLVWPAAPRPRYAGYTCWRFITPRLGFRATLSESWGTGERVGIVPLGDGSIYSYLSASIPAGLRAADEHVELRRRFGGWHDPIPAMIDSVSSCVVLRHDIYHLPKLASFVADRIALVGDAAHAMTPDLGQGAGTSFEDAVELARQVTETDLQAGLTRYDRLRRPRTQRIARQSALFGRIAQSPTRPAAATRDLAARALPIPLFLHTIRPMLTWA